MGYTISTFQATGTRIALFPVVIIILVGLSFLQAWLSKKESETPGLVLPAVSFITSILLLLSFGLLSGEADNFAAYIVGIAFWFILLNIPTIAFAVIFSVCRKDSRGKREIEKMNIMDLE